MFSPPYMLLKALPPTQLITHKALSSPGSAILFLMKGFLRLNAAHIKSPLKCSQAIIPLLAIQKKYWDKKNSMEKEFGKHCIL